MSIAAVIPVDSMVSANAALEAQGFGPDNFSLPVYTRPEGTHATLHSWGDDAFEAAVKAIPGVVWSSIAGQPPERVGAAVSQISQNAGWSGNAQPLVGVVTPGLYVHDDKFWWVIQTYNTAIWPDPNVIPALVRRARIPGEVAPWRQPLDQFDAYKLLNPFTGLPDRVTHNGQTWQVSQADGAGNNVWEPGVFGWTVVQGD